MKYAIRSSQQITQNHANLDPFFNVGADNIGNEYFNFLDGYETVRLKDILLLKDQPNAKKGDLIIETKYFKQFRIFITDIDRNKKSTIITIRDKRVTKSYLLWCLSQKPIVDYISQFSQGSYISYIPLKVILETLIPLHKKNESIETTILPITGKFKKVIEDYLISEYYSCRKNNLLLASMVIAGSITESIISELLVFNGVKEGHLKNKTLGALIEFAKIEGILSSNLYEYCKELSSIRNHIHANKLIKTDIDIYSLAKKADELFNKIIKEIGL